MNVTHHRIQILAEPHSSNHSTSLFSSRHLSVYASAFHHHSHLSEPCDTDQCRMHLLRCCMRRSMCRRSLSCCQLSAQSVELRERRSSRRLSQTSRPLARMMEAYVPRIDSRALTQFANSAPACRCCRYRSNGELGNAPPLTASDESGRLRGRVAPPSEPYSSPYKTLRDGQRNAVCLDGSFALRQNVL